MKKITPFLLVAIFVTSCAQTQPEKFQVEVGLFTPLYHYPETLHGKVKEVYERNYIALEENGRWVNQDRLTVSARDTIGWTNDFHLLYDEEGHLQQSEQIGENDQIINRNKLFYEEGKLVRSEYLKDDTLRTMTKIIYDENGIVSTMEKYRVPEDTLILTAGIIIDVNGYTLEWRFFNPQDELTGKYVFTLDENGKRTGYKYFNTEGEQTFEQQYSYNDMDFMLKQVLINSEGKESVASYEYEYDDKGNWIVSKCSTTDTPSMIAERTMSYYEE